MLKRDEQSNKKKCEVKREECSAEPGKQARKSASRKRGGKWNERAEHRVPW